MNQRLISMACAFLAAAAVASGQDTIRLDPPELPQEVSDPELEVLSRGPVHEAFVEQITPDPVEGIITSTAPPEPVNEVAPDMRPDGEDVLRIPGYWFWDDERSDYVWISGVWRRVPPGRRWVPGYWKELEDKFQWIAGFWSSDAATDVEYLDLPPESLESGPSSPAPSDDYFWSPGNWVWDTSRYQWQPGTWCQHRNDWLWVPARWLWTPRGCIYISGYWDYSLTRRGHLFAPVYYRSPIFRRAGYAYHPSCWIGYEPLLLHLFVRPYCNHLYFGDFHAPRYRQLHYTPCYAYHARHRGYSSLYTYYEHYFHRQGIDYCRRVRDWHSVYATHADYRPAHTYRQQMHHSLNGISRQYGELVRPYNARQGSSIGGSRLIPVSSELSRMQQRHSNQFREISRERNRFEGGRHDGGPPNRATGFSRLSSHGRLALPDLPSTTRLATTTRPSNRGVPTDILSANRALRQRTPLVRGQDPVSQTNTTRRRSGPNSETSPGPRESRSPGNIGDLTSRARVRSDRPQDRASNKGSDQPPRFRSRTEPSSNQSVAPSLVTPPTSNRGSMRLPLSSDAIRRSAANQRSAVPKSTTSPPGSRPSRPSNGNATNSTGPRFSVQAPRSSTPKVTVPTPPAPANPTQSTAGSPRGQRRGFGTNSTQSSIRNAAPPTANRSAPSSPNTGRAFGSPPRSRASLGGATSPAVSSPPTSRRFSSPTTNGRGFGSSAGPSSAGASGRSIGAGSRSSSSGSIGNRFGSSAGPSSAGASGRSIGAGSRSSSSGSIGNRFGSSAGPSSAGASGRSIGAGSRSSSSGSIGNRGGPSSAGASGRSIGAGSRSSSSGSIGNRGGSSSAGSSGRSSGSGSSGSAGRGSGRGK